MYVATEQLCKIYMTETILSQHSYIDLFMNDLLLHIIFELHLKMNCLLRQCVCT